MKSSEACVITVRSENRKYVMFRKDNQMYYEQYFDLENDPWEMENLMDDGAYSEEIAAFRDALQKWEADTEKVDPLVI